MPETSVENKTFAKACMDHFGRLPGQSVKEFGEELRALTPEDRAYFIREFAKIGVIITP